jgi:hypothetical protein
MRSVIAGTHLEQRGTCYCLEKNGNLSELNFNTLQQFFRFTRITSLGLIGSMRAMLFLYISLIN